MTTPNPEPQRKLIRVGRPAVRASVTFEPVVPIEGPIITGPLIHVARPLVRGTLTFEPVTFLVVTKVEVRLLPGTDGERMFDLLYSLIRILNELEAIFDRPGVWVDGAQSDVLDGKIVMVLVPNDSANAVEACKRVADQLFAAIRTIGGVTVRVLSADHPDKPLYELPA